MDKKRHELVQCKITLFKACKTNQPDIYNNYGQ